jgi:hypothetical protein
MAHMLVLAGRLVPRAGVSPAAAAIPRCEDAGGRVPDAVGTRLGLITLGLLRSTSLARMRGARPVAWACRGLALGDIRDSTLAALCHCHSCPARLQLAVVGGEGSRFNPAACVGRKCSPEQIMTCRYREESNVRRRRSCRGRNWTGAPNARHRKTLEETLSQLYFSPHLTSFRRARAC